MYRIHSLELPSYLQANTFENFARDRYLPALAAVAKERSENSSLMLLRRASPGSRGTLDDTRLFLLLADSVEASSPDLTQTGDPTVNQLFAAFGAAIVPLGTFDLVANLKRS